MSIATAITAAQGRVADCYTAISNKGGTLPATQNLANMPAAIGSIPSGGGSTKYGVSIDNMIGNADANGVLQLPTSPCDIVFTGVKDVAANVLTQKFLRNSGVGIVSFPDLETASQQNSLSGAFQYSGITSISFPKLESITGQAAFSTLCSSCSNLQSISFPELKTISGSSGINSGFGLCSQLQSVSLPKLSVISGSSACYYMFQSCSSLTQVSLPELTKISASNGATAFCSGCTSLVSVSLQKLKELAASSAASSFFYGCSSLQEVSFNMLDTITGSGCMSGMFNGCTSIKDVYFPSLTTTSFGTLKNQFSSLLYSTGTTIIHTLHFPSNLESTIQGLTGYPLFGGTSGYVTLSFDLTATT